MRRDRSGEGNCGHHGRLRDGWRRSGSVMDQHRHGRQERVTRRGFEGIPKDWDNGTDNQRYKCVVLMV